MFTVNCCSTPTRYRVVNTDIIIYCIHESPLAIQCLKSDLSIGKAEWIGKVLAKSFAFDGMEVVEETAVLTKSWTQSILF